MDTMVDESPRARLAVLFEHFSELDDDREAWRVVYPIAEVLLLVTCATIASCDDFEDIVEWGEHHLDFLRQFSEFHHGIPCARWLRDLVNRIDPALFARCFKSWVGELWPGRHDFIAIDGKTARRTHDHRKGLKALPTHLLGNELLVVAHSADQIADSRAKADFRNGFRVGSGPSKHVTDLGDFTFWLLRRGELILTKCFAR